MSTVPPTPSSSESAPPSDRDARGRFTAGNKGGPGNPFARRVAALRGALLDRLTPEVLARIVQALIAKAEQGDVAASKLLFAYGLGQPAPTVDPDQLDMQEWQHYREQSSMLRDVPSLVQTPTPELPLQMVRGMRPTVDDRLRGELRTMVSELKAEQASCQEPTVDDSSPSPNGGNGSPSPRGKQGAGPSRPPSANGTDGAWLPPDEALEEFYRELFGPSPNGKGRAHRPR